MDLKVAWLYKFSIYTTWPAESFPSQDAAFVMGMYGAEAQSGLSDALKTKIINQNRLIQKRRVEVRNCNSPEEAKQCHLVFISSSAGDKLSEILRRLTDAGILTVGEAEDFTKLGGVINLTIGQKEAFEVSKQAEKRAKLVISSDLKDCGKKVP